MLRSGKAFKGSYNRQIDRSENLNNNSGEIDLQTMESKQDLGDVDKGTSDSEVDVGHLDSVSFNCNDNDRGREDSVAAPMAENIDSGNSEVNVSHNFMESFLRQMTEKLNEVKDEIKQSKEEARNNIESKLNDFRADVTTDIQNNIDQLARNLRLNFEKVTENFQGELKKFKVM